MPRNTQVTRILLVLRRLETARGPTLEELARALPPEYPKNLCTLRRGFAAIEDAGFPLVTDRSARPGAFSGGTPRGRSLPSGKKSSYPPFVP